MKYPRHIVTLVRDADNYRRFVALSGSAIEPGEFAVRSAAAELGVTSRYAVRRRRVVQVVHNLGPDCDAIVSEHDFSSDGETP